MPNDHSINTVIEYPFSGFARRYAETLSLICQVKAERKSSLDQLMTVGALTPLAGMVFCSHSHRNEPPLSHSAARPGTSDV
jgi:hypothetical protein